ncbi:MAG TPA: YciI family protein [Phycisphaerales bacterium]|nr:YciI family protein [Phycisphaerales bacterium]
MGQYLCIYSPPRDTFAEDASEAERRVVGEHFAYLEGALGGGTLVLAGRTLDRPPMGIAVFEAEHEGAARAFVDADPAVRAGVFRAEVRPYRVALLARAGHE